MGQTLQEGMTFEFVYIVPPEKTVPYLFPEFPEGGPMPEVLATGFLVGLLEFACIKFVNPHIEWPRQQTVGIHINVSHTAATPPGFTVTVKGKLEKVDGRSLLRPGGQRRHRYHLQGNPRPFHHRCGKVQRRGGQEENRQINGHSN